jgi:hypothetical protein
VGLSLIPEKNFAHTIGFAVDTVQFGFVFLPAFVDSSLAARHRK